MPWTKEDWLIIDNTLNHIAKSLRRIEQEEKKLKKQREREVTLALIPAFASLTPQQQSETASYFSPNQQ